MQRMVIQIQKEKTNRKGRQREKETGFHLLFLLKKEDLRRRKMRKGKLQQSVLVRSVFKMLGQKREDATGPAVGRGVSALAKEAETEVFSCAPVLVKDTEDAVLAVCRVCNSVAAAGATAKGVLVSLLLPETMEEKALKELMREIDQACVRYGAAVIGGHTEVTDGVLHPVLTVTAAGTTRHAGLFDPSCVTAELDLVVTKGIALGASAYLARTKEKELLTRFSPGFIHGAADFSEAYPVFREAEIAMEHGAAAMQDLSEGGIFGALWEMADGAGVGLDVTLKKIPIRQETVEICEFFGVNPYQMLSTGSLLIATADGQGLVQALEIEGIPSAVIGRTTSERERILRNGEEIRYLDKPQMDEMYRIDRT